MIKWPEPVFYQYRWTNPDGEKQPASRLEWKGVEPAWNQTVAQKCDELLAYRYKGEPPYEVRALVPESQLKQAVRDAYEDAAKVATTTCHHEATSFANGFNQAALNIEAGIRALIKELPHAD